MIGPLPAVAPSDDVAFVLQGAGLGALVGAAVTARRKTQDPGTDTWLITARWMVGGALLAALLVVLGRVL